MRGRFRAVAAGAVIVIAACILALALAAYSAPAAVTAARFSILRANHTDLRSFLGRMPKGADLHVHLSGAVYAEDLIAWAAARGLCLQLPDVTITASLPCDETDKRPPVANALKDQDLYDRIINALSMRNFAPSPQTPSGHDQFFDAFPRFGAITTRSAADMTVERLRHYASDSVQYTELMVSILPGEDRRELAALLGDEPDFAKRLVLLDAKLAELVARLKDQIDAIAADVQKQLGCAADKTRRGCDVGYRLIAQIIRTLDEKEVFVQTAFAAALIKVQPLVVALNFVGPEDYRIAREDYTRHMAMIGFLAKDVPVALHAGELWLGLVPPDDLAFHIRQAVEIAGAKRIGHGTALAFERRSGELLAEMRRRSVAVEINLTSNDVILGVRGKDHPLPAYRTAGVPVVLSTDDAGVARIDLTNEYFRAARDYRLRYRDLKLIARNSLIHSFLGEADKQAALARFDRSMAEFERSVARERTLLGNMTALIRAPFFRN